MTNNLAGFTRDNLYQLNSYHQFTVESSINIHCIATTASTAEELGFEVAMLLQAMRLISGEMLELQYMGMPSQSRAQTIAHRDWSGKYNSVVSFRYVFTVKRKHTPIDPGELLKEIEINFENPSLPKPGDVDQEGNPINNGGKGGTNTGGNNGNWGGNGGINGGDGIDDGWVNIKLKVTNESIEGSQEGQSN